MFSFREAVERLLSRQKFSMLEANYVRGGVEDKLRSCMRRIGEIVEGLEEVIYGFFALDTVLGGFIGDVEDVSDEEWNELYGDVIGDKKSFVRKIDGWLERLYEAHDPLEWIESCLKGVYKEIAVFLGEPYEIGVGEGEVIRGRGENLFERRGDLDVEGVFDKAKHLLDELVLVLNRYRKDVGLLLRSYGGVLRSSWIGSLSEAIIYFDEEIRRIEKLRWELLRIRPE